MQIKTRTLSPASIHSAALNTQLIHSQRYSSGCKMCQSRLQIFVLTYLTWRWREDGEWRGKKDKIALLVTRARHNTPTFKSAPESRGLADVMYCPSVRLFIYFFIYNYIVNYAWLYDVPVVQDMIKNIYHVLCLVTGMNIKRGNRIICS